MVFDFAATKLLTRRTVHTTFGVSALYQDSTLSEPLPIKVRWHSKIDRFGDNETAGYAEVIEGIHRVIFSQEEARAIGVRQTGVLIIASLDNAILTLESREPSDGPYEEVWGVVKDT